MIVRVDIDGTICKQVEDAQYADAVPIFENIKKINRLYNNGHAIIYWTSRGTTTGIDWYDLTLRQLNQWGCLFCELRMEKPYYDLMICDKTKRIEEI